MHKSNNGKFKVGGSAKPVWRCFIRFFIPLAFWNPFNEMCFKLSLQAVKSQVLIIYLKSNSNPSLLSYNSVGLLPIMWVQACACVHACVAWTVCSSCYFSVILNFIGCHLVQPDVCIDLNLHLQFIPTHHPLPLCPSHTSLSHCLFFSDCVHCSTRLCVAIRSTL